MVITESGTELKRNRNYAVTHRLMIAKAIELIAESFDAVSVSAVARATRINRSTVYYHFGSREVLIAAVHESRSQDISQGGEPDALRRAGMDHIPGFVRRNPELIKSWMEHYLTAGDIRQQYPEWDSIVAHVAQAFAEAAPDAVSEEAAATRLGITRARLNQALRIKLSKFSLDALVSLNAAASAFLAVIPSEVVPEPIVPRPVVPEPA